MARSVHDDPPPIINHLGISTFKVTQSVHEHIWQIAFGSVQLYSQPSDQGNKVTRRRLGGLLGLLLDDFWDDVWATVGRLLDDFLETFGRPLGNV